MWFKGILCIGCILFFCPSFVAALPNYFTTPTSTPAKIYWRVEDWNPSPSQTTQIPGQSPSPFPVTEPTKISSKSNLSGKTAIVILFHNNDHRSAWEKISRSCAWINSLSLGTFQYDLLSIGGTMNNAKFVENEKEAISIRDPIAFYITDRGNGLGTCNIDEILQGLTINRKKITSEVDFINEVKKFGKTRGDYDNVIIILSDDGAPQNGYNIGSVVRIIDCKDCTSAQPDYVYGHEILHYFGALDNYNSKFIAPNGEVTTIESIMWYKKELFNTGSLINAKMLDKESQTELGLRQELGIIFGNISFFDNNVFVIRYLPFLECDLGNIGKSEYTVSIEDKYEKKIGDYFFKFDVCYDRYDYAIALPPGDYFIKLSADGYDSSKKYPIIVKAGENNYKLKDERITLKRNSGWLGFPFSIG